MALKDSYFTISQAAKHLGVTRQTVSRWVAEGKLLTEKVGRETLIEKAELERYRVDQAILEGATRIIDGMIDFIREKYRYTDEDVVNFIKFDHRKTFWFSVKKADSTSEIVAVTIGKAKLTDSKDAQSLYYGLTIPVESTKTQRRRK